MGNAQEIIDALLALGSRLKEGCVAGYIDLVNVPSEVAVWLRRQDPEATEDVSLAIEREGTPRETVRSYTTGSLGGLRVSLTTRRPATAADVEAYAREMRARPTSNVVAMKVS